MPREQVNILEHKKTKKLHVETNEGILCGRGKWDKRLEALEVMTTEEFDQWVTDPEHAGNFSGKPALPGVTGLRRGLCVGCRQKIPALLVKIRKN
jgi:hypothetical protein